MTNSVTIRGVRYESQNAAAAAFGVHPSSITRRLSQGTIDGIGLSKKRGPTAAQPVIVGGVKYPSLTVARAATGVHCDTIKRRVRDGENACWA